MTDNEIIKALECCSNKNAMHCSECNYFDHSATCTLMLLSDALDLINRKNAEIERITGQFDELSKVCDKLHAENVSQKAEIERLDAYNENLLTANTALSNEILDIKSETIKAFAARLKECSEFCNKVVFVDTIDNLVKEMRGDGHE